jgi:hypothetical protein
MSNRETSNWYNCNLKYSPLILNCEKCICFLIHECITRLRAAIYFIGILEENYESEAKSL